MATHPNAVSRFASGPLHGCGLALYFVLLPYVVLSKWGLAAHQTNGALIRILLIGLALFWLLFLYQLARNIARLRRGLLIGGGGSAWLAGLVVAALPFLISSGALATSTHSRPMTTFVVRSPDSIGGASTSTTTPPHGSSTAHSPRRQPGDPRPLNLSSMSAIPLALVAKRRSDMLRQQQFDLDDEQIDTAVELLRASSPDLIARLHHAIGNRREGVVHLTNDLTYVALPPMSDPLVVCVLSDGDEGVFLSFAREGGRLRVPAQWSDDDIAESVVALHEGGRLSFAREENELLRTLATRVLRNTLVVYLGSARDLDEGLRACSVTIDPVVRDEDLCDTSAFSTVSRPLDARRHESTSDPNGLEPNEIRIELLRAEPRIVGLAEPFTPTLRRRCVEMVAYLALHRHEPITGDRLRTRVLTHAEIDASTRTLANTATAVRRSLGVDAKGPRLHPVTSSGLYVTRGLTSDVEIFHSLVNRARQLPLEQAAPFCQRALSLVRGEPLASALRGFEWFLAEGHSARLLRDGEWAALALHQHALNDDDYELAFWAIGQGRLIDPYSDALVGTLARVPRLREFGGDGSGLAQHEPIGTGGAVAMGGSFDGLGN